MGQIWFPAQAAMASSRFCDQVISGCCTLSRVTTCPSLLRAVLVYSYFPGIIINSAPFHFQEIHILGNKLDGHCNGQEDSSDVAKKRLMSLGDKRVFAVQVLLWVR